MMRGGTALRSHRGRHGIGDGEHRGSVDVDRMFAVLEKFKNGATQVQLDGIGLRRLGGGGSTVDGRATVISAAATPLVVFGK